MNVTTLDAVDRLLTHHGRASIVELTPWAREVFSTGPPEGRRLPSRQRTPLHRHRSPGGSERRDRTSPERSAPLRMAGLAVTGWKTSGVARAGAPLPWATTRPAVFRPSFLCGLDLDGLGPQAPLQTSAERLALEKQNKKAAAGTSA